jgi:hypothetical protein
MSRPVETVQGQEEASTAADAGHNGPSSSRPYVGGRRHKTRRTVVMAATMWIEVESGTDCTPVHPHSGYWAGDFGSTVSDEPHRD